MKALKGTVNSSRERIGSKIRGQIIISSRVTKKALRIVASNRVAGPRVSISREMVKIRIDLRENFNPVRARRIRREGSSMVISPRVSISREMAKIRIDLRENFNQGMIQKADLLHL